MVSILQTFTKAKVLHGDGLDGGFEGWLLVVRREARKMKKECSFEDENVSLKKSVWLGIKAFYLQHFIKFP